jgi:hypothetical protein
MNKILVCSVVSLCFALPSMAQVTLTAANLNPVAGDAFITKNCDTTGVTQGPAGASQTWNFSGLTDISTDSASVVPCMYMSPLCTWAPGSNIGTASVSTVSSVKTYLYASSARLSQCGVFISNDENATFSDPIDQFRYPFTYPNSFTDNFTGTVTFKPAGFSTAITATQTGSATVTCDGWGTLILPHGITASSTLRVHTSEGYRDAVGTIGLNDSIYTETYTWYKPDFHTALLTIQNAHDVTAGSTLKLVSYTYGPLVIPPAPGAGVTDISAPQISLELYPNPATDELNIKYGGADDVRISLCDMLGRQVAQIPAGKNGKVIRYNTAVLAKGLYLVRMEAEGQVVTKKLQVQ